MAEPFVVTFTGDFFTLTTVVEVDPDEVPEGDSIEQAAEDLAAGTLMLHYGWDVREAASVDIEVSPG